jgi:hypothetical protein
LGELGVVIAELSGSRRWRLLWQSGAIGEALSSYFLSGLSSLASGSAIREMTRLLRDFIKSYNL